MKSYKIQVRARYPEVDRMGVVHHTHYLTWFEMGRTELMRERGCSYASMEDDGVMMPVVEAWSRYHASVRYDDVVEVETSLSEVARSRVVFTYRLTRPGEEGALAEGRTVHATVNGEGRVIRLPDSYRKLLNQS